MTNIVILTGAGISAESGIQTFRDSDGMWNEHDVMAVATPEGFQANPKLVHEFYNARRGDLPKAQPNAAHEALARLEAGWKGKGGFLLITQNVDDLHERAGSKNLAHMHGELNSVKCTACNWSAETTEPTCETDECPVCSSEIRPDVVWFGEFPRYLAEIEKVLGATDIYIAIGTSGSVMPASLFAMDVRMANPNAKIIEINPVPTGDKAFDRVIAQTAVEGVSALVDELLALP